MNLPEPTALLRQTQSLAVLDALLCAEPAYRYYHFSSNWWGDGQHLAQMDNGAGDRLNINFLDVGVLILGFDHECALTPYQFDPPKHWPGLFDEVPQAFTPHLEEPAMDIIATTFCLWRTNDDSRWQQGKIKFPGGEKDPDGAKWMLNIFDGDPKTYQRFADQYYEQHVPLQAIEHIYNHDRLTDEIIGAFGEAHISNDVRHEIQAIGYPMTLNH